MLMRFEGQKKNMHINVNSIIQHNYNEYIFVCTFCLLSNLELFCVFIRYPCKEIGGT